MVRYVWILAVLPPGVLATACMQGETAPIRAGRPAATDARAMIWVAGGRFQMGGDGASAPETLPVHPVTLSGFWLDAFEVTNADFTRFVSVTGHRTVAELVPRAEDYPTVPPGSLVAGSVCFHQPTEDVPLERYLEWWRYKPGADWRHPDGPASSIVDRARHPVVHVAWTDAVAYCRWLGKRLPTEAEWEYAARGGPGQRKRTRFMWGDDPTVDGRWMANIWQGRFPAQDLAADGFHGTAPVGSFPPNGLGLYDLAGNVWEWTADWYRPDYYANSPDRDPPGPVDSFDPGEPAVSKRVQRGGSFLCSERHCLRYTPAARGKGAPDTGANHLGFRCAR